MRIVEVLNKDSISLFMQAEDKNTLLDKMIELAAKSGKIGNLDEARNEIYERERIMSTGVGKGIALPHAKTNAVVDSIGALAILSESIDFDSLDGKPVNLVFMLLGRENNVGNHLRLLSKISRLLNNDSFRNKILKCSQAEDVMRYFDEIENEI